MTNPENHELQGEVLTDSNVSARWPLGLDVAFVFDQAKAIMTSPDATAREFNQETVAVNTIYRSYLAILIAGSVLAGYLGMALIGVNIPPIGHYRVPIISGFFAMIVRFVTLSASPFITAKVLEVLAPNFDAKASFERAFKLTTCTMTPGLVGGLLSLIPLFGIFGVLLSLYGLYLYCKLLPIFVDVPQEKRVVFTVVSLVVVFVTFMVLSFIMAIFTPGVM